MSLKEEVFHERLRGFKNTVGIRHLEYPLSPSFIISNFFFGSFSTLGNCPYKFVQYLEPHYL